MSATVRRPICRDCGEEWSRLDVMLARLHAWYAWPANRRRVRAWVVGVTVYVLVTLAWWPVTGNDPVSVHVLGWWGLVDGLRAAWGAFTAWVAALMTTIGGVWS